MGKEGEELFGSIWLGRSGLLWFWKGKEGREGNMEERRGSCAGVCMCDVSGPEGDMREKRVK